MYSYISIVARPVPKFDRTMSDIYQDELYNPTLSSGGVTAPKPSKSSRSSLSTPFRSVITDRLQQANEARSTSPNHNLQRDPSPFRQGSPFASTGQFAPHRGRQSSLSGLSVEARDATQQTPMRRRPMLRTNESQPTISPQDAELVYHEPDDGPRPPSLFPEVSNPYSSQESSNGAPLSYGPLGNTQGSSADSSARFPMPGSNFSNSFARPTIPASNMQAGNDFKSATAKYRPTSSASVGESSPELPARLISMETSTSGGDEVTPDDISQLDDVEDEEESGDDDVERPNNTTADTGTYTCTYHGCTRRFETPAQLQKHKRDGHRAVPASSVASGSNSPSTTPTDSGMTSAAALRNSQAGPHRCDRVNPQTGKPCNTVFSRPYDLTRHEDTIHNNAKKKVRCHLCTEEKTFSRSDALTRHMRVVHPEVDFPIKHKKRD